MRALKFILVGLRRAGMALVRFPSAVRVQFRVWRRLSTQDAAEAERIDRIRHPDKYRGK